MAPVGKYALVAVLVGLSAFGFRCTLGPTSTNGLGEVLNHVSGRSDDGTVVDLLGAPTPFKRVYTGVPQIDGFFTLLVSFFAALVDDTGVSWEIMAFYIWGMAQFTVGWILLVLESRRSGNRGLIVSWITVFGILIQTMTWTFTVPLYLALHLLTSPIAKLDGKNAKSVGDAARRSLIVYRWDLTLIPLAVTLMFVTPAVLMSAPSFFHHAAATHYNLIAFWQVFPVWTMIFVNVFHNIFYYLFGDLPPRDAEGKLTTPGKGFSVAVAGLYKFGLAATVLPHVTIVLVSLLPTSLRSALISAFPEYTVLLSQFTFTRIFVPYPISAGPTVDPNAYAPGELATVVIHFLQYDFYVGTTAMVLWASYLNFTTRRSAVKSLWTTVFWTLVGGPAAAALALTWDRDEVVMEGESDAKKTK